MAEAASDSDVGFLAHIGGSLLVKVKGVVVCSEKDHLVVAVPPAPLSTEDRPLECAKIGTVDVALVKVEKADVVVNPGDDWKKAACLAWEYSRSG